MISWLARLDLVRGDLDLAGSGSPPGGANPANLRDQSMAELRCCRAVTHIVLAIARTVLRGVSPYPDLIRRGRVRRRARALGTGDRWPQDEANVTGLDYA